MSAAREFGKPDCKIWTKIKRVERCIRSNDYEIESKNPQFRTTQLKLSRKIQNMKLPRSQSMRSKTKPEKPHIAPKFYGVYLLRSIPKPGTFYIGSTPDPVRRLRQHNGELTSGAYRTKRKGCRPWDMIMLVHGFPNKIAALQFEHAWQHCYQTRHIDVSKRITTTKTGGRSLAHKVGNVRLLLNAPFFKAMALKIMCFDEVVYNTYVENKFRVQGGDDSLFIEYVKMIPNKDDGNLKDVEDFKEKYTTRNKALMEKFSKTLQHGEHECPYCDEMIDYINSDEFPYISICYHNDCENICHLMCLYKQTVDPPSRTNEKQLIPQKVKCQKCSRVLLWAEVAKISTWIRGEIGLHEPDIMNSQQTTDMMIEEEDNFED
ncbi:hypothetical protein WICPIJ_006622 [Wickerhamomyces pijperi]|uniref:GIY-YIG domain-containing protein n=1 Tax=Wickerhamomyces pijperi TaxID=599730 RepID=A0A9P8Q1C3_WICPI|nr:hypothetical protein WICPIJ_006622 [Wickerhamomyces pijperi]